MVTKDIHNELPKWKDLDNLIGWKKQQYSNLFPRIYWLAGIFFFGLNILVFQAKSNIINIAGVWTWVLIVVVLTLLFIWMLFKISEAHKTANENIEYLYRKKDRQKV